MFETEALETKSAAKAQAAKGAASAQNRWTVRNVKSGARVCYARITASALGVAWKRVQRACASPSASPPLVIRGHTSLHCAQRRPSPLSRSFDVRCSAPHMALTPSPPVPTSFITHFGPLRILRLYNCTCLPEHNSKTSKAHFTNALHPPVHPTFAQAIKNLRHYDAASP